MNCPRCGRTNDADAQFCARCGLEFAKYATTAAPIEAAGFCYRHPKVATNLSCGRCERPVCTKCAINGPAGIRCRDCARHNVAIRPGAVVYGVKRSLFSAGGSVGRFGPWGIYALLAIASMAFGAFRSCGREAERPRSPAVERPAPD